MPEVAERRAEREAVALVERLAAEIRRQIIARLADFVDERQDAARMDQRDPRKVTDALIATFSSTVNSERNRRRLSRVGRLVSAHGQAQTGRQFQQVLGIPIQGKEPFVQAQIEAYASRNASLITNAAREETAKVADIILEGQRLGLRHETLAKQIEERVGVLKSRAGFIARDQVGKLNAQITQERQTRNGVRRYIWRTSQDGNVREMHADLEGTTQSWDEPPVTNEAGDTNHPGEDYGPCRCTAEPILEDVLADLEASDARTAA